MKGCVAVFTCDEWKSHNSMKLVGIFTDRKKLISGIKKLITKGIVECEEDIDSEWTTKEINDHVNYVYLDEFVLNKIE